MLRKIFTRFRRPDVKVYRAKWISDKAELYSRHKLIPGFDQQKLTNLSVLQVGAGGLGSEVSHTLVKKGVGQIHVFDHDTVELSNLPRQNFSKRDLGKYKTHCLGRNLKEQATGDTTILTYPFRIEEMVRMGLVLYSHVAVVLVDNEQTRVFCSNLFHIPVIFAAVGINAERLYVAVQERGKACYRCMIPEPESKEYRCQLPSCIDVNKVAAGLVAYALDSLIMGRERTWNYMELNLCGLPANRAEYIEKNPDCPLCGGK